MEENLSQELVEKMMAAKSVIVFMFNPDETVQGFASGEADEMIVTIASEMQKSRFINAVVQASVTLFHNEQAQKS